MDPEYKKELEMFKKLASKQKIKTDISPNTIKKTKNVKVIGRNPKNTVNSLKRTKSSQLLVKKKITEKIPVKKKSTKTIAAKRILANNSETTLKNIDLNTAEIADLVEFIKQPARTVNDRYRILDARDKLIRLHSIRETDLNADKIKGTCPDMCPEKERLMREAKSQFSTFEQVTGPDGLVSLEHRFAVKQYSRSSADQEIPLPHEIRSINVLKMTMNYLLHNIINLCENNDINLGEWYHFIWDRTRSIRKDITHQDLCSVDVVELVEQCARFHIHCSAHLINEDLSVFDEKINTENLTKCLQTLKYMYHDLSIKSIKCPNETEFRAYIILLNLKDANFLWEVQKLSHEIQKSSEINECLEFYSAYESRNYSKFFKLVRKTTYLNACILFRYFNHMRYGALEIMLKAYSPGQYSQPIPIEYLEKVLAFESYESAVDFVEYFGLNVNKDGYVLFDKKLFYKPDLSYRNDRAYNLIETKRNDQLIGEIICGKKLPDKDFETHIPECSFDVNGYLKQMKIDTKWFSALKEIKTDINEIQSSKIKIDVRTKIEKTPLIKIIDITQTPVNTFNFVKPKTTDDSENVFTQTLIKPKFSFTKSASQPVSFLETFSSSNSKPRTTPLKTSNLPPHTSSISLSQPSFTSQVSSNNLTLTEPTFSYANIPKPSFGFVSPQSFLKPSQPSLNVSEVFNSDNQSIFKQKEQNLLQPSFSSLAKPILNSSQLFSESTTSKPSFNFLQGKLDDKKPSFSFVQRPENKQSENNLKFKPLQPTFSFNQQSKIETPINNLKKNENNLFVLNDSTLFGKHSEDKVDFTNLKGFNFDPNQKLISSNSNVLESKINFENKLNNENDFKKQIEAQKLEKETQIRLEKEKQLEIEKQKLERERQIKLEKERQIQLEKEKQIQLEKEKQLEKQRQMQLENELKQKEIQRQIEENRRKQEIAKENVDIILNEILFKVDEKILFNQNLNRFVEKRKSRIASRTLKKWRMYTYFKIRNRESIENFPLWLPKRSLFDEANEMHMDEQLENIRLTKRYKKGCPDDDLNLNVNKQLEKCDILSLFYNIKRNYQESNRMIVNSIYWKVNFLLPIENEHFLKLLENSVRQCFLNTNETNNFLLKQYTLSDRETFNVSFSFVKQLENVKKHFNDLIFFGINDSNTFAEVKHRFECCLNIYKPEYFVVILQNSVNPIDGIEKEFDFPNSLLLINDRNDLNQLLILVKSALVWLSLNTDLKIVYEMDKLSELLNQCLGDEFKDRIYSSSDQIFLSVLNEPNNVVEIYNEALMRTIDLIETEFDNVPQLSNELKQFLPKIVNFPCNFMYFPNEIMQNDYVIKQLQLLQTLIVPEFNYSWPPKDITHLENMLKDYVSRMFPKTQKVYLKVLQCVYKFIGANNEQIGLLPWLNLVQILVNEKLIEISHQDQFCIYNKINLKSYKTTSWWLEIDTILNSIRNRTITITESETVSEPLDYEEFDIDEAIAKVKNIDYDKIHKNKLEIDQIRGMLEDLNKTIDYQKLSVKKMDEIFQKIK